jgi:hypothetical protein
VRALSLAGALLGGACGPATVATATSTAAPVATATSTTASTATAATARGAPEATAPTPEPPPPVWYCTLTPVESACATERVVCEDAHLRLSEALPCEVTAEVFCTATPRGDDWEIDRCFAVAAECGGHRASGQRCLRNPRP